MSQYRGREGGKVGGKRMKADGWKEGRKKVKEYIETMSVGYIILLGNMHDLGFNFVHLTYYSIHTGSLGSKFVAMQGIMGKIVSHIISHLMLV